MIFQISLLQSITCEEEEEKEELKEKEATQVVIDFHIRSHLLVCFVVCHFAGVVCVFVMTAFNVSSSMPPGLPQGRDDTGTFYIYLMFCLLLVLFPRIKGTVLFRKCR